MNPALETALALLAHQIATIPTKGDKRPLIDWKDAQTRLPTEDELRKYFATNKNIAVVGGQIQCLDFDEKYSRGIFEAYAKRSEEAGLDQLIPQLVRQRTPSGGYHLVWRCQSPIRNLKLASKPNHECAIETRGEGGYFLIHPSPGYTLEQGDWSHIPLISEEDRDALLDLARTFDEQPPRETQKAQANQEGETPGDDYDFRADVPALLRQHGWTSRDDKYWTRPGKKRGISASWDVVPGRFWVFSSSTQFEPQHCYRPWHIYAILECGGDFSRAARELKRQGFGHRAPKTPKPTFRVEQDPPAIENQENREEEDPPGIEYQEGIDPDGQAPTKETEEDRIRRMIDARRFDPAKEPPPLRPIYSVNGIVICTPGNLTAITAQAKVGKSSFVAAMIAATFAEEDRDLLGVSGFNPHGKAVLYVDSEQAPDDFWHTVDRSRRRAGQKEVPAWLRSFTGTDLPAYTLRKAIALELADAAEAHGGIHSVFIDGIADLALDVNDAEECNSLVAELHGLAIRYDCAIIAVIHKNPGTDKTRGHLGSQIERKAETNLSLDKEDGITVVWSQKQRRAPITKDQGIRFAWDEDLKMHATVSEEKKQSAKIGDMVELAESVLRPNERISWKELVARISDARTTVGGRPPAEATVSRWLKAMKQAEVITVSMGQYGLNPKHQIG